MTALPDKRVIFQCKMHRGIFIVPAITTFSLTIPLLLYGLVMSSVMSRVIPGGQSFSSMWLLMLLPGLFLGLGSFVVTLIEYLKSEVVLTDEHLRFKVGWLSLGSTEIMLSKIETITLFEPLIGRLAGYGTVAVTGTGGTAFHLRFLPDSKHLHSLLQTMVNQAQTGQAPRYSSPTPSPSSNETRYMPKG